MIYLDYAATAPLRPAIAAALGELHGEALGNPSSLHRAGRRARFHLEQARERCAQALGAKVEEIVFCSGATEADNLAVLGPLWHQDARHRGLITSALEHAAVYETAHKARSLGQQVNWLQVTSQGQVDLDSLRDALIRQPRSLVSVMACNNEVGSRQPLDAVSDLCREHGSLLHVDAVQEPAAAVRLIREARADLLTLSGHKMGGLPGGLLYVRQGVPLAPQIVGGAQEDGRRAGTSEVVRSVALALALESTLQDRSGAARRAREVLDRRLGNLPEARRLGPERVEEQAEHISSWLFGALRAEPILAALDMKGVCASSGSACSSHAVEPSRVVQAMGFGDRAMGLVRFSTGWNSDEEQARRAADLIEETVLKMREKVKR